MTTPTPPMGSGPTSIERGRESRLRLAAFLFIVGIGVVLSFGWGAPEPGFRADAPTIIVVSIAIATVFVIVSWVRTYVAKDGFRRRFCTQCGRQIPFDALVCPYCGHDLP